MITMMRSRWGKRRRFHVIILNTWVSLLPIWINTIQISLKLLVQTMRWQNRSFCIMENVEQDDFI